MKEKWIGGESGDKKGMEEWLGEEETWETATGIKKYINKFFKKIKEMRM